MRKYFRLMFLATAVILVMGQAVYAGTGITQKDIDEGVAFCKDYPVLLQVDGEKVEPDVPPVIVKGKTLIPVRAVFEGMGADVSWDEDARLVEIAIGSSDVKLTVDLKTAFVNGEPKTMDVPALIIEGRTMIPVRFVGEALSCGIGWDDLSRTVIISSPDGSTADTDDGLDVVDQRAAEKLVVIDPGHGGKDTGSQAIRDGVEILNEKDVNLDVALRLNEMLKAAGVSTYILRETDTTITLYDRPALANAANADLYVCIHNNSSDNSSAKGTEVYYNSKASEANYGIYSKDLADAVYENMLSIVGISGRGSKSEPAYAVLNKTNMPAIIIEGAFLSNTDDLKLMMTDEFRQNYALATAKAVVQILNESVEGQ